MNTCIFTGSTMVERHHVFGGVANRPKCEKYGFVVPLRYDIHPNGASCTLPPGERKRVDTVLKQYCQQWYEDHVGSREEFIKEFDKNYL